MSSRNLPGRRRVEGPRPGQHVPHVPFVHEYGDGEGHYVTNPPSGPYESTDPWADSGFQGFDDLRSMGMDDYPVNVRSLNKRAVLHMPTGTTGVGKNNQNLTQNVHGAYYGASRSRDPQFFSQPPREYQFPKHQSPHPLEEFAEGYSRFERRRRSHRPVPRSQYIPSVQPDVMSGPALGAAIHVGPTRSPGPEIRPVPPTSPRGSTYVPLPPRRKKKKKKTSAADDGTQPSKKWAAEYAAKCEAKLPRLKLVFDIERIEDKVGITSMGLLGALVDKVGEKVTMSELAVKCADTFVGLKFSKRPGQPLTVWDTAPGKVQSAFRKNLSQMLIEETLDPSYRVKELDDSTSDKPQWIAIYLRGGRTIDVVHKRKETLMDKKRRGIRDKQISGPIISEYVIEFIYKKISHVLINSRRRTNEGFFVVIGYLFVTWRLLPFKLEDKEYIVDQECMTFKLEEVDEDGPLICRLPNNANNGKDADVYAEDLKAAKLVMRRYNVTVEHKVLVKTVGGIEVKKIQRKFFFFDIACRALTTFSFGSNDEAILRLPHSTFRAVSLLAYVLYMLVKKFIVRWNRDGAKALENIDDISFGSLSLKSLIPGDYRAKEMLSTSNCLVVSKGDRLLD